MADPRDTDPLDRNPRERGLEKRADAPVLSPLVVLGGLAMLGAAIYVISALL